MLTDNIPSSEILDYEKEMIEILPSLYRESTNYINLLLSLIKPLKDQQERLLWLKNNILNIDLAEESHLDFIGEIVGQPRFLVSFTQEKYFGFEGSYQSETLSTVTNPNLGGFWNTYSNFVASTSRRLTDEQYRRIIKARIIYINSDCSWDDLVKVVNLLTNTTDPTISLIRHGLIGMKVNDQDGFLAYFIDRLDLEDNILPITFGVSIELQE